VNENPSPLEGEGGSREAAEGRGDAERCVSEREVPSATAEIAFGGFEPPSVKPLTRRYAPPSSFRGEGYFYQETPNAILACHPR
jgi:hypothetical protein